MKRVNVSRIDSSHGEMHIIQEETLSTENSEYKKDSEIADIKRSPKEEAAKSPFCFEKNKKPNRVEGELK